MEEARERPGSCVNREDRTDGQNWRKNLMNTQKRTQKDPEKGHTRDKKDAMRGHE